MRARNMPGVLKRPGHLAVRRDGDDAAIAFECGEFFADDVVDGFLQALAFVLNASADGARDGEADEVLAGAGGGDGAGVGGVGAGADDGRVPYPAEALGLRASGGGAGGDIAVRGRGRRCRWCPTCGRRGFRVRRWASRVRVARRRDAAG